MEEKSGKLEGGIMGQLAVETAGDREHLCPDEDLAWAGAS